MKTTFGVGLDFKVLLDGKPLPAGIAGCLQVINDLAKQPSEANIRMASDGLWDTTNLWTVEVSLGAGRKVAWRLPEWRSYADYLDFMDRWSRALKELEGQSNIAVFARRYMCAVLRVDGVPMWEELARRVAHLAAEPDEEQAFRDSVDPSEERRALRVWARTEAGLLAAPEAGLPAEEANAWLDALRAALEEHKQWVEVRTELGGARRARLTGLSGDVYNNDINRIFSDPNDTDRVLLEFDRRWPDHAWRGVVGQESPKLMAALVQSMEHIFSSPRGDNLAYYLTPRRREALGASPPDLLDRLQQALRVFANQSGTLGVQALERLWQVATEGDQNNALRSLVRFDRDHLEVAVDQVNAQLGGPFLLRGPTGNIILDGGESDAYRLGLGPARLAWSKHFKAQSAIYPLLEMAWDIAADSGAQGPDLAPWWTVGGGSRGTGIDLIPWPAVSWPRLFDWERILTKWNTEVLPKVNDLAHEAGAAYRAGARDVNSRIYGDAAAYWLVRISYLYGARNFNLDHFQFVIETDVNQWRNLVSSIYADAPGAQHVPAARSVSYLKWRDQIGLFAAPESGLSRVAAEGILAGIPDLQERRKHLSDLRKTRLEFLEFNEHSAMEAIATWNKQYPTHPWTVQIETP